MTATQLRPATTRGTSNSNARGGSEERRRRRAWLVVTFRANVDADWFGNPVALGTGTPACRCYRCGRLLIAETDDPASPRRVTVDRIIPGCQGGTYRRTNIRPACGACNSETGGSTRSKGKTR